MKNISTYFTRTAYALLLLAVSAGCEAFPTDDSGFTPETPELSIRANEVENVPREKTTLTIPVESNLPWRAGTDASWISFERPAEQVTETASSPLHSTPRATNGRGPSGSGSRTMRSKPSASPRRRPSPEKIPWTITSRRTATVRPTDCRGKCYHTRKCLEYGGVW